MTIHLISVGKSICENLARPHHSTSPWRTDPALATAIERRTPHEELTRRTGPTDTAAADALLAGWFATTAPTPSTDLRDVVTAVQPSLWPAGCSAELDTINRALGTAHLPVTDLAVLLATDTLPGLTAALWNAIVLGGADLTRVRYLSRPEDLTRLPPGAGLRGTAMIVRVLGLTARSESELHRAMGGLGELGAALVRTANPGEDVCFYLSGGLKATIPYLIGLAEGMRSLPQLTGDVRADILHEDTTGGLIRLPLRRIDPDWVRGELEGFDAAGAARTRPRTRFLEGYAYEREPGGMWELTAFGLGLRALFGPAPAALHGP